MSSILRAGKRTQASFPNLCSYFCCPFFDLWLIAFPDTALQDSQACLDLRSDKLKVERAAIQVRR